MKAEEIIKSLRRQATFGSLNITLQVLLVPVIVFFLFIDSVRYSASLILTGLMVLVSGILTGFQISAFSKTKEEISAKLRSCGRGMFLSCIPVLGLFTAIPATRAYYLIDVFKIKEEDPLQEGTKKTDEFLSFGGTTHALNVCLGMLGWFLLGFIDNNIRVLNVVYAIAIFSVIYGLVTLLINIEQTKHNLSALNLIKNLDKDNSKRVRIGKKSVKGNFLTYIPLLGIFALIPYFIIRETNKDLKEENHDPEKQYLHRCRFFVGVVVVGSVISLPYLIAFASLGGGEPAKAGLATPLIVGTITSLSINFTLAFEKSIYSEMYLVESKNYAKINELNNISKIVSGMSILSLPAILPGVIVFVKKLRQYNKNIEAKKELLN